MHTRLLAELARSIDDMDADELHAFLRRNRVSPADVGKIAEPLRGKIYSTFDDQPWKKIEIERLVDNPNS